MPKVMLRLRTLEDGVGRMEEHESVEAAIGWLEKRPKFTEVLGVVFEGITKEDNERMKHAMRPLEDEEKARIKALDEIDAQERAARAEARRKESEESAQKMRDEAKNAPPTRPMELRYRFDDPELVKTDGLDERDITDEAKAAVIAWVHERMEWIAGRGQTVGEAKVTVYPGVLPANKERVVSGTFIPVSAPAKGDN